jgi:hypothetical protein
MAESARVPRAIGFQAVSPDSKGDETVIKKEDCFAVGRNAGRKVFNLLIFVAATHITIAAAQTAPAKTAPKYESSKSNEVLPGGKPKEITQGLSPMPSDALSKLGFKPKIQQCGPSLQCRDDQRCCVAYPTGYWCCSGGTYCGTTAFTCEK